MKWLTTVSLWAFGALPPRQLQLSAVGALEEGFDSPSLRQLAGLPPSEEEKATVLFGRVLEELRQSLPSKADAGRYLAREIARQIVDGTIEPYEGARRIWWEVYNNCRELREFATFAGMASEFEEHESSRPLYARMITDAATELLARRPRGGGRQE